MPTTIRHKRKAGAFVGGELAQAEWGLDITNSRWYYSADGTTVTAFPPASLTWTAPTLLNSWAAGATAPAYSKDAQGIVRLRGVINTGTIGTVAFTLPAGFRPASLEHFAVDSAGAFGRYSVAANGDVTPLTGTNTAVWLSGGAFSAA